MTVTETLASFKHLPTELQKHLAALEDYIGDTDGKDTVLMTDGDTCIDDGTIDASEAVTAFNGIVAALTAALSDIGPTKELTLVRSQLAECHKEIFKLREALLAAPPPWSYARTDGFFRQDCPGSALPCLEELESRCRPVRLPSGC